MPAAPPRLGFEQLETRDVPNSRFVVPPSIPADGLNTFHTLRSALTTPGLVGGDFVQIEPGSTPGLLRNADLPAVAGLSIRGNPAVGRAETPPVVAADQIFVGTARSGLAFRQVNLILTGGPLTFQSTGVVEESSLTGTSATATLLLDRPSRVVVNDNLIVGTAASPAVVQVNASVNSNNQISGNQIIADAPIADQSALRYTPTAVGNVNTLTARNPVTDQVVGNTLVVRTGRDSGRPILSAGGVEGLVVRENEFRDTVRQSLTGIELVDPVNDGFARPTVVQIVSNRFNGVGQGVSFNPFNSSSSLEATIAQNSFDTRTKAAPNSRPSWGVGIQTATNAGVDVRARIEGNEFQYTRVGVLVTGSGTAANLDLGGGSMGSRGVNNFRTFDQGTSSSAAVLASGGVTGSVSARTNLFGVPDPTNAIFDQQDNQSSPPVVTANTQLIGNQAFLQTLYLRLLRRFGNLADPNDAGGFLLRLNTGTPASTIVNEIAYSNEGVGVLVDSFFRRFLSRDPDVNGRNGLVGFVLSAGTPPLPSSTVYEQLAILMIQSDEYRRRFGGSDTAYAASLYERLLGRAGSDVDLQHWANIAVVHGRGAAAFGFLTSGEFRSRSVRGYYLDVLKRPTPPSDAEVASWTGQRVYFGQLVQRIDVFRIVYEFLFTGEYRANG